MASLHSALGLLAAAGLLACGAESEPLEPAPPPTLVPAIRLIDTTRLVAPSKVLDEGGYTSLGGVERPTLASARPFRARPLCKKSRDASGLASCVLRVPVPASRSPWVIVETVLPVRSPTAATRGEEAALAAEQTKAERAKAERAKAERAKEEHAKEEHAGTEAPPDANDRAPAPGVRTQRALARGRPKGRVVLHGRAPEAQICTTYGVPSLSERVSESSELRLPGGGVLRAWIGVEEAAWDVGSAPVAFVVERLEGEPGREKRSPLFRKVLDTVRRPEDRGWQLVEIELEDLGDRPFRLRFSSPPADAADERPSLPVWADPTILRPETRPPRARRIVLVSLDTLRARSMSAYGYELETTPKFEVLRREGALFARAFTTFSNTLASHMSMLTGLYPATHSVRSPASPLDESLPTLAERLRADGYETAAFTENGLLAGPAGFRRGFAHYRENKDVATGTGDAERTFADALAWATQRGSEPFFLFVHTYEVHAPYLPPESTADAFASAAPVKQPDVQRLAYEREIRHLDGLLGELVSGLDRLGSSEELLLVVTADHGEEFLEHGRSYHSQLYDEVLHVPLLLRWPGVVPAGATIEAAVSLVDVVPTILELSGSAPSSVDGVSLVPLLEGATIDRAVVLAESAARRDRATWYAARSADAKCMVSDREDPPRCFDLRDDPMERDPIEASTRTDLVSLERAAVAYRERALGSEEGEASLPKRLIDAEADPERREKLRALGYVD